MADGQHPAQRAQAVRYARYTALRDEGQLPVDAARNVGIAETTRLRYERSYRRDKGLPPRRSGHQPYNRMNFYGRKG